MERGNDNWTSLAVTTAKTIVIALTEVLQLQHGLRYPGAARKQFNILYSVSSVTVVATFAVTCRQIVLNNERKPPTHARTPVHTSAYHFTVLLANRPVF